MEYKRKRLIRAALQKAETKRKQTARQAESAADAGRIRPDGCFRKSRTGGRKPAKQGAGHRTNQLPSISDFTGKAPACANHTRRPAR